MRLYVRKVVYKFLQFAFAYFSVFSDFWMDVTLYSKLESSENNNAVKRKVGKTEVIVMAFFVNGMGINLYSCLEGT